MWRGCLHVSAPSFFFPWFFAARWNSEALRPVLLLIGSIKDRLSLQISRRSWMQLVECWISRTGVTVPENALNITERCRATAAAAAGHSGISYGPNWSLRCLASNGMSLISFPADHICLFLPFLLLLLWCANIPCCPWLTDRGRTTHPPQPKWGQHECVMLLLFFSSSPAAAVGIQLVFAGEEETKSALCISSLWLTVDEFFRDHWR